MTSFLTDLYEWIRYYKNNIYKINLLIFNTILVSYTPLFIYKSYRRGWLIIKIYAYVSFFIILRILPLLTRRISQQIIQLLPTLHIPHESFLWSVRLQITKKQINCLHRHPQSRHGVYHTIVTVLFECANIDVWCLPELCHIG